MIEDTESSRSPQKSQDRPTMKDIADHLGMSRQLVSIVLRNADGASDESRQRVMTAARELGYYPDDSARMLRRRRSGQLGVLFTMRQPFEVDLVDALYRQASNYDYRLVLSTVGLGRSQETALDELMRQRIEALIVLTTEAADGVIHGLPSSIPVVLLGGPQAPGRHDEVHVENERGMLLAVDHLAQLGHRRIAYVGPFTGPNAAERREGYNAAMRLFGLGEHIDALEADYTEEAGFAAARHLLARADRPTALVCANDRCAFGVMETFLRDGVRVPDDISIVGFDDSTVAGLPFIDLTSVRPNPEHMAKLALEAASKRLANPNHDEWFRRVPPTLVVRGTSSAPAHG